VQQQHFFDSHNVSEFTAMSHEQWTG